MKSFKEFMNEVYLMTGGDKRDKFGQESFLGKPPREYPDRVNKNLPDLMGHKIKKISKNGQHHYQAIDKKGNLAASLDTNSVNKHTERVSLAVAHSSSKVPMHKLYAHILKHSTQILMSDHSQTEGGKKIWHSLSKERNVGVHGWANGKAHNLGARLDDTTDDDTHHARWHSSKSTDVHAKKMLLVAHRK